MTKQKKGIIALAVILVAVIGIGYAALTDQLTINGKSSALAADFGIEFDQESEPTVSQHTGQEYLDTDQFTVSSTITGAKTATFNVAGLKKRGDTVELTYVVKNTGDVDASVNFNVTPDDDANYTVYMVDDNVVIPTGESGEVTIYVELSEVFADEDEALLEHDFEVELNATAA